MLTLNDWQWHIESAAAILCVAILLKITGEVINELLLELRTVIFTIILIAAVACVIPGSNVYKAKMLNYIIDFRRFINDASSVLSLSQLPHYNPFGHAIFHDQQLSVHMAVCAGAYLFALYISGKFTGVILCIVLIVRFSPLPRVVSEILQCPCVPVSKRRLFLFSEDFYRDQVIALFERQKADGKMLADTDPRTKRAKRLFHKVKLMCNSENSKGLFKYNSCFNKMVKDELFELIVVDSPDINAYTYGWGKCVVLSGLLDSIEDDTIIAGILAHEMAHMIARHADESVATLSSLKFVIWKFQAHLKWLFNWDFSFSEMDLAFNILYNISSSQHSQLKEEEADAIAVELLKRNHNGAGVPRFFALLMRIPNSNESTYFSTHPSHKSRYRETSCRLAGYTSKITRDTLRCRSSDMLQGMLGLDRLYLGHNSLFILKLGFSCTIVLGILWWLYDRYLWNKMADGEGILCMRSNHSLLLPKNEREIHECQLRYLDLSELVVEYKSVMERDAPHNERDELMKDILDKTYSIGKRPERHVAQPLSLIHKLIAIFPPTGMLGIDRLMGPSASISLALLKFSTFGVWYVCDLFCIFYPQSYAEVNMDRIRAMHPFTGLLGIDRYWRGHYGLGFLKMVTAGLPVFYLIDALQSLWYDYSLEKSIRR